MAVNLSPKSPTYPDILKTEIKVFYALGDVFTFVIVVETIIHVVSYNLYL